MGVTLLGRFGAGAPYGQIFGRPSLAATQPVCLCRTVGGDDAATPLHRYTASRGSVGGVAAPPPVAARVKRGVLRVDAPGRAEPHVL